MDTLGYASRNESCEFAPLKIRRREKGKDDVGITVLFCGICHSDILMAANDWKCTKYPIVPGHEIVGVVESCGDGVSKFKPGDLVGVGCFVNSCGDCESCNKNEEPYCPNNTLTYNSVVDGQQTYGGYSKYIVVRESFVLRIPDYFKDKLANAAPLLCAGITTYSPMKRFKLDQGNFAVGVIGLGGLGHMAVQIAKAWKNKVTVISTSQKKKDEALANFKADFFVNSRCPCQMGRAAGSLDFIIDTVGSPKELEPYLSLLKTGGMCIMVGLPPATYAMQIYPVTIVRRKLGIVGSLVGGIKETQEMLDFCAAQKIQASIELITFSDVETAYQRVAKSDVKYRFVIDVKNSPLAA